MRQHQLFRWIAPLAAAVVVGLTGCSLTTPTACRRRQPAHHDLRHQVTAWHDQAPRSPGATAATVAIPGTKLPTVPHERGFLLGPLPTGSMRGAPRPPLINSGDDHLAIGLSLLLQVQWLSENPDPALVDEIWKEGEPLRDEELKRFTGLHQRGMWMPASNYRILSAKVVVGEPFSAAIAIRWQNDAATILSVRRQCVQTTGNGRTGHGDVLLLAGKRPAISPRRHRMVGFTGSDPTMKRLRFAVAMAVTAAVTSALVVSATALLAPVAYGAPLDNGDTDIRIDDDTGTLEVEIEIRAPGTTRPGVGVACHARSTGVTSASTSRTRAGSVLRVLQSSSKPAESRPRPGPQE